MSNTNYKRCTDMMMDRWFLMSIYFFVFSFCLIYLVQTLYTDF